MKHVNFLFLATILLVCWGQLTAQTDTTLKVRFSFDNATVIDSTIIDESGNSYVGTLKNGATIYPYEGLGGVLNLGGHNGNLDLGAVFGTKLISKLHDFTISTYIYTANDAANGINLIFEFGNHNNTPNSARSWMYFKTLFTRYLIVNPGSAAQQVQTGSALEKGTWKHIAITYTGTTAKIYVDGALVSTSASISLAPNALGATTYNTIGGSSWPGELCLTQTLIDEFRVYNVALPDTSVAKLASLLSEYNVPLVKLPLYEALATISLKDGQKIISNLTLPTTINEIAVSWSSSDSSTISSAGVVVRPPAGSAEKNIALTATAISGSITATKQFSLIVLPALWDSVAVKIDADSLNLGSKIKSLRSNLTLPKLGLLGSTITWKSDLPSMLTDDGKLLYLPAKGTGSVKVTLTATLSRGTALLSRLFDVIVADSILADRPLLVRFTFDNATANDTTVTDESGNGFIGTLKKGAVISQNSVLGGVLNLGNTNSYFDLGAAFGTNLISNLRDFTISTYIYIANDTINANIGNFVFSFGNSDNIGSGPNGFMYFYANNPQYAISKTDWNAEQRIQTGSALTEGTWKHLAITYTGTTAKLYIDGTKVATSSISMVPQSIGATAYNYIGKFYYYKPGSFLTKTLIDEFRIYRVALPDSMISELASSLAQLRLTDALTTIPFKDGQKIINNLSLPTIINGFTISWSSSDSSTISPSGVVVRPVTGSAEKNVTLTATATSGNTTATKQFNLIVLPAFSDIIAVNTDADSIKLSSRIKCLRTDLTLPTSGLQGSTITWKSDSPTLLTDDGKLLYLPAKGPVKVTLTATITRGTATITQTFIINIAEKDPYSAYLFVHFKEGYESIRFSISDDGYHYKVLNKENPVLNSNIISSTGGVRDPHILRGADGITYYMVATDMMAAKGWDSNRAIVLLKSTNLIDWQSSVVNIATTYSQFANIKCAWAPQTIYDKAKGKYMIYWSMGNLGAQKIYYAYANASFTALETEPKVLFENPSGVAVIDADIIEKDSLFHMFFKKEGYWMIMKAVSTSLTGQYTQLDKYLNSSGGEGPCVYRLIDSDTYIMMYDAGIYKFTESTDLTNFTVIDNLISMDFAPKHGTVMTITKDEKDALMAKWNPTASINSVTSFTPSSAASGTTVTITGMNFSGVTAVGFGGTPAASFNVVSPKTITAVVGTGATGSVSVTTPGGTSSRPGFTYKTSSTGIAETHRAGLQVYPNPASDYIVIKSPNTLTENVKIFDIFGHLIMESKVINEHMSVQNLAPGVYILKINDYNFRLIKK